LQPLLQLEVVVVDRLMMSLARLVVLVVEPEVQIQQGQEVLEPLTKVSLVAIQPLTGVLVAVVLAQ
jgi:hypothetical protein